MTRPRILLACSALAAAVFTTHLSGQEGPPRPAVDPAPSLPAAPAVSPFRVWTSRKDLAPDQRRAFEHVRDVLSGIRFVPAHRRTHFAWIIRGGPRVRGWSADVIATDPAEDGYLVTVRIWPETGGQMTVVDHSVEVYRVFRDGTWDFVEGRTPPGTGEPALMLQ